MYRVMTVVLLCMCALLTQNAVLFRACDDGDLQHAKDLIGQGADPTVKHFHEVSLTLFHSH